MRIVLTTLGSLGDVQPFVALAVELRDHGHQCVFALPLHLLAHPQRFGFEAHQLGPDLREVFEQYQRYHSQNQLTERQVSAYHRALLAAAPQAFQELQALCAAADLIVSSEVMPLSWIIHELTSIPFVYVRLAYPPTLTTPDALDQASLGPINLFRVRLGLPPISSAALRERADHLALFAFSRAVLPPQPSWPKHYHVTGFFFLDDTGWQPDHGLTMFLQAGPPPVVISLGSTMHDDPAQLTALFLATISAVGCRAVLQRGWSGLAQDAPLPDSVYAVDYVPHEWLLPRAACVVHHGGAGTLAAVMRAGVPMVVIPHTGDQFILARHAQNLGSAGPVCPYQALNVNQLSAAIAATLTDPRYHTAALAVRERIRAEQGVQTARMLIEQFAHTA